ncbi:MAG: hypothetical protein IJ345_08505 [Clostridia bacterium]|nr:hypothetical protein [Clostridia bacterium]
MKQTLKRISLSIAIVMIFSLLAACNGSGSEQDETTLNDVEETTLNDVEETTANDVEETTVNDAEDETTVGGNLSGGEETTIIEIDLNGGTTAVDEEHTETDGDETTVGEFIPGVDTDNYDSNFYLSILNDSNPVNYYWIEENDNSVLSNALYERQQKIKEQLGIDVFAFNAGYSDNYTEDFKTSVAGKLGSIDTLLTHTSLGISDLVSGGFLAPLNNVPGLNLDADYWNQSLMDSLKINDLYLLGFSDFNIPNTYVITFNPALMAEYSSSLDKSLYQMVDDYEWTLQQFADVAKLGYVNNGSVDSNQYGLTGLQWVPWCGFLEASGVNLIEMNNEGEYEISFMSDAYIDKTKNIVSLLTELASAESTCLDYMQTINPTVPYFTGRALMTLTSTYDISSYLNYDIDFGVLPYPVFDSNQKEYRSLQWGGYIVLPAYMENAEMVGKTLDLLAFYSEDVKNAFYQTAFGVKLEEKADDVRMMDIVWDSVCSDFAIPFDDVSGSITYMLPTVTSSGGDGLQSLSEFAYARIRSGNAALKKFFQRVDKKY